MSSEMRESKFTNEDLETISRTWNSNKYTEHTAMLLASELLRARALLARTEAGADGAVGYVSADGNAVWLTEGSFSLKPAAGTNLFTHPQDASGDAVAELIAAADVLNTGAKHGLSTYPEDWKRLDAALNAMQAKEAK